MLEIEQNPVVGSVVVALNPTEIDPLPGMSFDFNCNISGSEPEAKCPCVEIPPESV
jgi:hypothetical protein